MAFDFPNTPTEGQTHSPGAGVSYIYSSGAWRMIAGPGATYSGAASDTPPPNPAPNTLWWESDTGRLFIYYADVDTGQWVQISGPLDSSPVKLIAGGVIASGTTVIDISLVNAISAGYRSFHLRWGGWRPTTNAVIPVMYISTDGGSTWSVTNYGGQINYSQGGAATTAAASANPANQISLSHGLSSTYSGSGTVDFWLVTGALATDFVTLSKAVIGSGAFANWNGAGHGLGSANAIRLGWSSGTFAAGNYALYGFRITL